VRFDPTRPTWSRSFTWPRRVIGLSVAAVLVIVAVGIAVFGVEQSRTPSNASEPSPSPTAGRVATERAPGDALRTGPGATEPGILLEFNPRGDGGFDVTENVMLRLRVSRIVLTPPSRRAAGTAFSRTKPEIRDLRIQGDDGQPLGRIPAGGITRVTSVPLGGATSTLVLRYRLSGTSVRSIPSSAGRALAFLRPITAGFDSSLGVRVIAGGVGTLNLTCPALPALSRACAAGTVPELRVRSTLDGPESTVVVQLDLPDP
jgi:hypothetical protein